MDAIEPRHRPLRRAIFVGLAVGVAYGLLLRWMATADNSDFLRTMTFAFLAVVPFCMGFATILPQEKPKPAASFFLPWVACMVVTVATMALGWEGSICVVLSTPLMFCMSSLGGLSAYLLRRVLHKRATAALVLLPFAAGPIEQRIDAPIDVRRVTTSIEIDATPDVVWSQIESVPEIRPEEEPFALYRAMGFPRPVSAVIDRPGVGGVREARFDGGVLFLEKVTVWEPGRRLEFTIDAQEHLIPPTTLDPHVTIGGPYFDVLTGTYEIEARADGGVVLHLASELRVSTTFNFYAGWWADRVMASIQDHILAIVKARSERIAPSPRTR